MKRIAKKMKTVYRRRFSGLTLVCLLAIVLPVLFPVIRVHADESAPGAAVQNKTVRVGMFPVAGYHDYADGNPVSGYGYDYLQMLRAFTTWNYQYSGENYHWPDMLPMLKKGEIDLVSYVQKTPDREKEFAFSKYPIGSSGSIMTVKAGSGKFRIGDYGNWNGIRVGMISDSVQAMNFARLAKDKGFTFEAVRYSDMRALISDLKKGGIIDAAVTSDMRILQDEWIFEHFDIAPFYIAVRKSDRALLNELDHAQERMYHIYDDPQTALKRKYYSLSAYEQVPYSAEEEAFIRRIRESGHEFVAVLNPDRYPLSYIWGDEYHGAFKEIADEIIVRSKLKIRFLPVRTREEYYRACADENVDIVFDQKMDFAKAEKLRVHLTSPLYTSQAAIIHRKNMDSGFRSFATVGYSNMPEPLRVQFVKNVRIVSYKTLPEAIAAVVEGECDATYQHIKTAKSVILNDSPGQLAMQYIPSLSCQYCVGVRDTRHPLLFSILSKAVVSLGDDFINRINLRYTAKNDSQDFLSQAIHQRPWLFIGGLAGILALTVAFLLAILSKRKREKQYYEEKNRLLSDVQTINECLSCLMQESDMRKAIRHVLQTLCTRVGADHAYALKFHSETLRETLICEYAAPGLQRILPDDLDIRYDTGDAWWKTLNAKKTILLNDLTDLKQLASFSFWQETIKLKKIKAIYIHGLYLDNELCGDIGLIFRNGMPGNGLSGKEQQIIGHVVRFIEIMIARHEAQRNMIDAMEQAKSAEKAKGLFLASMSHEIRTPLNAVIGFSELLRDGKLPEHIQRDYLDSICFAGEALLSLINDVLDLSKLEAGGVVFTPSDTDFVSMIHETKKMFQQKCDEKEIKLISTIDGHIPTLRMDKLRVRQILMNLLSNAVKFTGSGSITIHAAFNPVNEKTGTLVFHIIDTGIGISPEDQKKLFHVFVQSAALRGTQIAHNGTGIGLALSLRLAEKMNGGIKLTSETGKGSDFKVTLHNIPYSSASTSDSIDEKDEISPVPSYSTLNLKKKALLVDDVKMNLHVTSAMLEKFGITVVTAMNAREAIEKLKLHEFEFLLTDLWMPGMNGVELVKMIRESGLSPHMKTAILTADSENDTGLDFSMFDAVLTKPVTLDKIKKFLLSQK